MQSLNTEVIPLLGFKQRGWRDRARRYFLQNIRVQHAYLPLLVCCFLTGLIDAGSYNAWRVFMGMQTGESSHIREHRSSGDNAQATPFSLP